MQDKILAALESVARSVGDQAGEQTYDVANQRSAVNCGTAYVQRGWQTVVKVTYSFHDTDCLLTFTARPERVTGAMRREPARFTIREGSEVSFRALAYDDGTRVEEMLALFGRLLTWAPVPTTTTPGRTPR